MILYWSLFFFIPYCYLNAQKICSGYINNIAGVNEFQINLFKYNSLKQQVKINPHNLYIIPIYEPGKYLIKPDLPSKFIFKPPFHLINIDENSDNCNGGNNLNFDFKGFTLSHKIYTFPHSDGPKGINIKVFDKSSLIAQNDTYENGIFHINHPLLPGAYTLKAIHGSWEFIKPETEIIIDNLGNIQAKDEITLAGYFVKVKFLITYATKENNDDTNGIFKICLYNKLSNGMESNCKYSKCNGKAVSSLDKSCLGNKNIDGKTYKYCLDCQIKKDSKNHNNYQELLIANIIPGHYKMLPSYNYGNVTFEIEPAHLEFDVTNNDVDLTKTPYNVKGFNLVGSVTSDAFSNLGLKDVFVTVNDDGIYKEFTDASGQFTLNAIRNGPYRFTLTKEHYSFKPLLVHLTPTIKQPLIIHPEKFDVCGIFENPEKDFVKRSDSDPFDITKISLQFIKTSEKSKFLSSSEHATTDNSEIVKPKIDGTFCWPLKPGIYEPKVLYDNHHQKDAYKGIRYEPTLSTIKVTNSPIMDIKFTRSYVSLKGEIHCLNRNCKETIGVGISTPKTFLLNMKLYLENDKPDMPAVAINTQDFSISFKSYNTETDIISPNDDDVNNSTFTAVASSNYLEFVFHRILPDFAYNICLPADHDFVSRSCWNSLCLRVRPKDTSSKLTTSDLSSAFSYFTDVNFNQIGKLFLITQTAPLAGTAESSSIIEQTLPHNVLLRVTIGREKENFNGVEDEEGNMNDYGESLSIYNNYTTCLSLLAAKKIENLSNNQQYCLINDLETELCIPLKGVWKIQILSLTEYKLTIPNSQSTFTKSKDFPLIVEETRNVFFIDTRALAKFPTNRLPLSLNFSPISFKLKVAIVFPRGQNLLHRPLGDSFDNTDTNNKIQICLNHLNVLLSKPISCVDLPVVLLENSMDGSNNESNTAHLTFDMDLTKYTSVNVIVSSKTFIFSAYSHVFTYSQPSATTTTSYQAAQVTFEILPSVTFRGTIHPPTPGVTVRLVQTSSNEVVRTTQTDAKGHYSFGPLLKDNYKIDPQMDGFVFNLRSFQDDNNTLSSTSILSIFDFDIIKISQLNIQIHLRQLNNNDILLSKDQLSSPEEMASLLGLRNVLISLTGIGTVQDVKLFNKTNDLGIISYTGLTPGQYYILPIMKEYEFIPASQVVTVDDSGSDLNLKFFAIKSAFSCRGIVTSINGQPLLTLNLQLPDSMMEKLRYETENSSLRTHEENMGNGMIDHFYVDELYVEARGISSMESPTTTTTTANYSKPKIVAATDKCELLKEEGRISRNSGHFEVKALVPGCTYNLTLNMAPYIEHLTPKETNHLERTLAYTLLKSYPGYYVIHVPFDLKEDLPEFYRFKLLSPATVDSPQPNVPPPTTGGVPPKVTKPRGGGDGQQSKFLNTMPPSLIGSPSLLQAYTHVHGKISAYWTLSDMLYFKPNVGGYDTVITLPPPQPDSKILDFLKVSLYQISPNGFDKIHLQTKSLDTRSFFYAFDPLILDLQEYRIVLESTTNLGSNNVYPVPIYLEKSFKLDTGFLFVPFDFVISDPKLSQQAEHLQEAGAKQRVGGGGDPTTAFSRRNLVEKLDDMIKHPLPSYKSNLFKEMLLFIVSLSSLIIMIYGPERVVNFLKHSLLPAVEYVLNKSASTFKLSPVSSRTQFTEQHSNNNQHHNQTTNSANHSLSSALFQSDIAKFFIGINPFASPPSKILNDDSTDIFNEMAATSSSSSTNIFKRKNKSKKL